MYNIHHNYIKKKYNDKAKLLSTDTDSLTYEIETEDAYKDQTKKSLEISKMKYQEFQLMSS